MPGALGSALPSQAGLLVHSEPHTTTTASSAAKSIGNRMSARHTADRDHRPPVADAIRVDDATGKFAVRGEDQDAGAGAEHAAEHTRRSGLKGEVGSDEPAQWPDGSAELAVRLDCGSMYYRKRAFWGISRQFERRE